jgi:hypothetical protein
VSEPEPEREPLVELDEPDPSDFFAGVFLPSVPDSPPDAAAPSLEEELSLLRSLVASLVPAVSFERAAARELDVRSFFAQPLPLK